MVYFPAMTYLSVENKVYLMIKRNLTKIKKGVFFIYEYLKFYFTQRFKGFKISTTPRFGFDTTTKWFTTKLIESNMYIEFGSGSSTYFAAKNGKAFVTVDSDKYFLNSVKNKIMEDGFLNENNQKYIFSNIGLTYRWGFPLIVKKPSKERLNQFRRYSDFPVSQNTTSPLLILVDGRFRVACTLKALRQLRNDNSFTLVVDDYEDRPYYKIIENFGVLDRLVGRMAVFNAVKIVDDGVFKEAINKYEIDFR